MRSLLLLAVLCMIGSCYSVVVGPPIKWSGNNHWYQLVTPDSPVTYGQANAAANSYWLVEKQGYLVTINDVAESNWLRSTFFNTLSSSVTYPATWTGGKKALNNQWFWYALNRVSTAFHIPTGCPGNQYCNWAPNQPSANKNCVQASFATGSNVPGVWTAEDCTSAVNSLILVEFDTPTGPCQAGYTLSNIPYPQCVDIDECATPNKCGAGYTCSNTPGSFTCNDINECLTPNRCTQPGYVCTNSPGSFTCSPPTCANPCQNGGTCSGSNQCSCPTGWTGNTCATPVCSNGCSGSTVCVAPETCDSNAPWVRITNPASGFVLDIKTEADGFTYVVVNEVADTESQLWRVYDGFIQNKLTRKVVDVKDNQITPLRPIIVWEQKPLEWAGNQLWDIQQSGAVHTLADTQFCLDIYNGQAVANQPVVLWWAKDADLGVDNQRWSVEAPQPPQSPTKDTV